MAVLFLLRQRFLEHSFCTRGMLVYFLFVKASAVSTRSLKQRSPRLSIPFSHPEVGFQSVSCAKARLKCSDLRVNLPPATHLMVWPMPTDDDCGDVRAKELKAALAGCRVEGGWVWGG